jgi:hypothetical protein
MSMIEDMQREAEKAMIEMALRDKDEEIAKLRRTIADLESFLHGAAIQFNAIAGRQ